MPPRRRLTNDEEDAERERRAQRARLEQVLLPYDTERDVQGRLLPRPLSGRPALTVQEAAEARARTRGAGPVMPAGELLSAATKSCRARRVWCPSRVLPSPLVTETPSRPRWTATARRFGRSSRR
jgi:hypothetical protein